jgi:hypothetical protein
MNEASRWRLEFARHITGKYTRHPSVRAIMVSGSVARGCADRWSDVEIGVFWEAFPSRDEFQTLMLETGGTAWELDPFEVGEDVQYEEYTVGSLKIDLRHMTMAGMEAVLAAVVDHAEIAQERQEIVAAVLHGIGLEGEPWLAKWRARAADYPEQLAEAMIRCSLSLPPWWSVPMLAVRGDWHLVYAALHQASERIVGALIGLNRLYYPGSKWLAQTLARLTLTPPNLYARLMETFRVEPPVGAEQMRLLIEETFDLITFHRPDIDLSAERATFRYRRPIADPE